MLQTSCGVFLSMKLLSIVIILTNHCFLSNAPLQASAVRTPIDHASLIVFMHNVQDSVYDDGTTEHTRWMDPTLCLCPMLRCPSRKHKLEKCIMHAV